MKPEAPIYALPVIGVILISAFAIQIVSQPLGIPSVIGMVITGCIGAMASATVCGWVL